MVFNALTAQWYNSWPHLQLDPLLPRGVYEVAGQRSRCGPVGEDDWVLGVLTPLYEELPWEAGLQIGLAAQNHLRAGHAGQIGQAVTERQVAELERVVALVLEASHQFIAHPLDLWGNTRHFLISDASCYTCKNCRYFKNNIDIIKTFHWNKWIGFNSFVQNEESFSNEVSACIGWGHKSH